MTTGLIPRWVLRDRLLGRSLIAMTVVFVSVILGSFTSMDEWVQDFLHSSGKGWLAEREGGLAKVIFYDGPKVAIAVLSLALVMALFLRADHPFRRPFGNRRGLLAALAVLLFTTVSVAACKQVSGTYSPWASDRYGGPVPHHRLFERPLSKDPLPVGKSFPAGHASGGFGLVGLVWAVRGSRRRRLVMAASVALGSAMGAYQMAKGAHYLSHTLVTAAWSLAVCWSLGTMLGMPRRNIHLLTER